MADTQLGLAKERIEMIDDTLKAAGWIGQGDSWVPPEAVRRNYGFGVESRNRADAVAIMVRVDEALLEAWAHHESNLDTTFPSP